MARYIDGRCRICRRVSEKLSLKGAKCFTPKCPEEKRHVPPGMHAQRRRRLSDWGVQLREKQKARYIYGVLERQFRRYFAEAAKRPGVTGEYLLQLLERRLDNVIFRLGFADSRAQARQLVNSGHITINGRKTKIPSCSVKVSDTIGWRPGSTKTVYYKKLTESPLSQVPPVWLSLDKESMTGKVLSLPSRGDIQVPFIESAIVEYYSR